MRTILSLYLGDLVDFLLLIEGKSSKLTLGNVQNSWMGASDRLVMGTL